MQVAPFLRDRRLEMMTRDRLVHRGILGVGAGLGGRVRRVDQEDGGPRAVFGGGLELARRAGFLAELGIWLDHDGGDRKSVV